MSRPYRATTPTTTTREKFVFMRVLLTSLSTHTFPAPHSPSSLPFLVLRPFRGLLLLLLLLCSAPRQILLFPTCRYCIFALNIFEMLPRSVNEINVRCERVRREEGKRERERKKIENMEMKMGKNACMKMRLSPPPPPQPFSHIIFNVFVLFYFPCAMYFPTFHTDADTRKGKETGRTRRCLNVIKCRQMPRCRPASLSLSLSSSLTLSLSVCAAS